MQTAQDRPHAKKWIKARKAHLAHEKELTRARERLGEERRALPWVKVDKPYVFDGPAGKQTLADLFAGRSQLVGAAFHVRTRLGRKAARAARSGPTGSSA